MNLFARIGRWFLEGASHVGRLTYFVIEAIRGLTEVRIWWPRMMVEAWNIGAGSLFIVLLISGVCRGGHRAADRLSVHRQHSLLCRRHPGGLLDHPGAGPGADRADPGRPDRRPLRRRAGHHAGDRADRCAGEPGPLARLPPGDPAGAGRPAHDPGAHRAGQSLRRRCPGGSR